VKKSFSSMLLLMCLATPFAVTYLCLHIQKNQIRREVKHQMMEGLDRDQLVLLSFDVKTAAEVLRWKHSEEFEYQGRMYDIVESATEGEITHYWCWPDDEETELNGKVREIAAAAFGQHPQNQENQTRLIDFCKSLYHSPTRPWQAECRIERPDFRVFLSISNQIYTPPPGPPPQTV
jgi:hypothetical protein